MTESTATTPLSCTDGKNEITPKVKYPGKTPEQIEEITEAALYLNAGVPAKVLALKYGVKEDVITG